MVTGSAVHMGAGSLPLVVAELEGPTVRIFEALEERAERAGPTPDLSEVIKSQSQSHPGVTKGRLLVPK